MKLDKLRNLGISAHIDSGKTTLSERILYYTGRIHRMREVRGDGDGPTMDHMPLERERGITINSAATTVQWGGHTINLIDTPGHVDFTVEVERSLRVLDGAVLVLCAVGGVQSQSLTVDRQMKRYGVPRLAFINKMDRTGADPERVVSQVREKLAADAVLIQWPIGVGDRFGGLVDLIASEAVYFDGDDGERVRREAVPADMAESVAVARREMLEALSMYSDEMMERLLAEEEVPAELIHGVIREATIAQELTPVLLGSAYHNKGVQPLLDAVTRYLPSPADREVSAARHDNPADRLTLKPEADRPMVAMAFKVVDDPYGQLTYLRVYQGSIEKGQSYFHQRTGRRNRFGRLVRLHAEKREEILRAGPGEIVAVLGVDCDSGDTYAERRSYCTLANIFVPDPVIRVAVEPTNRQSVDRLGKALARYRKEDPTFHVSTDPETGETLLAGMGELHLEVYIERIRREYRCDVRVGPPKVSYREAPTEAAKFNYRHKKQTGGAGQFAHIVGTLVPLTEETDEPFVFEESIVGGRIPRQFISSIEKGFRASLPKGPVAKFPVTGLKVELTDGSHHEVDSSDMAFQVCAAACFRQTFPKTRPVLLEPVMSVEIQCPAQFQGAVTGDVISRRGMIVSNQIQSHEATILAEVPLAETFGYATDLRSMTQGMGTFSMELAAYRRVPRAIQDDIVAAKKKELLVAAR